MVEPVPLKHIKPVQNPTLTTKENELVNSKDSIAIGEIVADKFQILEQIGSGGFGSVYKAKHLTLNKTVALKILRADYVEDKEIAARFQHEAEIASHLHDPNIVAA